MNYYKKNISVIEKLNKEFSDKLQKDKNETHEGVEIISTTNFLVKEGSKALLAYPKGKENDGFNEVIKNIKLENGECTVIIGVGNGYSLNKLLKTMSSDHLILLIEPISQLLNLALTEYDLSSYLEKGKLFICNDKESLPSIFQFIESQKVIQLWHTIIENYTVFLNKYYGEVTKFAIDLINQLMTNVGTVIGAGKIIAENDIKNLPYVIKHRGVNDLRDLYKGKPAVIIASAKTVLELIPFLIEKP